jgi:enediyne biosynthesis protein E4
MTAPVPAALVLAAVVLMAEPAPPTGPPQQSSGEKPWLTDVTEAVGIDFVHVNGVTGEFLIPERIGAGVALLDYDNDGDLDVYLVQGGHVPGSGSAPAVPPSSRLWRNDLTIDADGTRHLRFTDVTEAAGVGVVGYGMGVATGDFDGDGFVDLYVTALGSNTLYRNRGDGTFEDVTRRAGVDDERWSTSAAFVDIDGDGHLDLFVTNYLDFSPAASKPCFESAGTQDYCPPTRYRAVPDRLFRNRGDGTFEEFSEQAGILRAFGNGLGVSVGDYDLDGHPDIYVANDAMANQLWRNLGTGRVVDEGPMSGAAFNAQGRPEGSMGIASGDYDADGDEDLVVTNIAGETFVLYENDGTGGFEDRRVAVGLGPATATMTGFGVGWADLDNDGVLDLVIANGAVNLVPALRGTANPYRQRNQLFRGIRAGGAGAPTSPGTRLVELTGTAAGPAFDVLDVSRGLAIGDLDNDGFPDVVITNNGGAAHVLRNTAASGRHWLGLELRQPGPNRAAIGATVTVDAGPAAGQLFRVRTDGSYLSASDARVLIGMARHQSPVTVTVTWPDGSTQRFPDVSPGRYHLLTREHTAAGSPDR